MVLFAPDRTVSIKHISRGLEIIDVLFEGIQK